MCASQVHHILGLEMQQFEKTECRSRRDSFVEMTPSLGADLPILCSVLRLDTAIPAGWRNNEVVFNVIVGLPHASYFDFLDLINGRKSECRTRVPVSHLSLLAQSSRSISICHLSMWVHGLFIV